MMSQDESHDWLTWWKRRNLLSIRKIVWVLGGYFDWSPLDRHWLGPFSRDLYDSARAPPIDMHVASCIEVENKVCVETIVPSSTKGVQTNYLPLSLYPCFEKPSRNLLIIVLMLCYSQSKASSWKRSSNCIFYLLLSTTNNLLDKLKPRAIQKIGLVLALHWFFYGASVSAWSHWEVACPILLLHSMAWYAFIQPSTLLHVLEPLTPKVSCSLFVQSLTGE
jgi:hypothetical protein